MCFSHFFKKKEYKIFQRFYKYKGTWDRLFLTTSDKKNAEDVSEYLTKNGKSEEGRKDYEGVVR